MLTYTHPSAAADTLQNSPDIVASRWLTTHFRPALAGLRRGNQGLGAGVGRILGDGPDLGVGVTLGVEVTVGVGVAVAVAAAVAVAVAILPLPLMRRGIAATGRWNVSGITPVTV